MARDIQEELRKLHEINPNVGVVHNGRTALEWYTLYCQVSGDLIEIQKQMETMAATRCIVPNGEN